MGDLLIVFEGEAHVEEEKDECVGTTDGGQEDGENGDDDEAGEEDAVGCHRCAQCVCARVRARVCAWRRR